MTIRARTFLMLGLGALLLLSLIVLIAALPIARHAGVSLPEARQAYAEQETMPAGTDAYILKDLNGRVAVYRLPEVSTPDMVTGIVTATLRKVDYMSLQTGIWVEGWENLQKTLEDFGP